MTDEPSTPPPSATARRPLPQQGRAQVSRERTVVLVVDDFDDNRLLYASTIAEAGYAVEEATNGQEAIEKIGAVRPAVIIMDLSMPVLDGWDATRVIKADPRNEGIVIIALTGHGTNFGLQRAQAAGADAVLLKPCLPQDLIGLIATLIPERDA